MGRMWRLLDVLCYEESRKTSQGAWDNKCLAIPKFTGPFFCLSMDLVLSARRLDRTTTTCKTVVEHPMLISNASHVRGC
ncbi:hypothetical protein QWA68_005137 [Fusarium oxysporum]|nr:hypothetical protein QWA68_005137 [Fusarium oxysporum]